MPAHEHHHGHGAWATVLPLTLLVVFAGAYLVFAGRETRRRGWSAWRTTAFLLGVLCLAAALSPPVADLAARRFDGHMLQHLLLGMLAPLGLVLAAPMTLLLRSLPHSAARRFGRFLGRNRALHVMANPITALALTSGGLLALYFTPLHTLTTTNATLHHAMHLHFVVSGCIFAWVLAGPDPAPRRPSVRTRLMVLGFAITIHAATAQLMYAGLLTRVEVPADERRAAADLMYYGGDTAEMLLALALLSGRRRGHRRTGSTRSGAEAGLTATVAR